MDMIIDREFIKNKISHTVTGSQNYLQVLRIFRCKLCYIVYRLLHLTSVCGKEVGLYLEHHICLNTNVSLQINIYNECTRS